MNFCRGASPHSDIEVQIEDGLRKTASEDTAIAWIRSHIGIPGNEYADRLAAFISILGEIQGVTRSPLNEELGRYQRRLAPSGHTGRVSAKGGQIGIDTPFRGIHT